MNWIILALSAAFFMALYHVFIKLSAGDINQVLGAVILQVVAAALGLTAILFLRLKGQPIAFTKRGITFAFLAGLSVGVAEILSFYIFSRGTFISRGVPVIIGGSIVFATLISVLFLNERLSSIHLLGSVLVLTGIILLLK